MIDQSNRAGKNQKLSIIFGPMFVCNQRTLIAIYDSSSQNLISVIFIDCNLFSGNVKLIYENQYLIFAT